MFVQRDLALKIKGAYRLLQPGYAEEELADDNPELLAFLNPPPDTRLVAIDDSIRAASLGAIQPATIAQLKAMTVAEYSTWFDLNFTTAGALIALLKRLTLVVIRRI